MLVHAIDMVSTQRCPHINENPRERTESETINTDLAHPSLPSSTHGSKGDKYVLCVHRVWRPSSPHTSIALSIGMERPPNLLSAQLLQPETSQGTSPSSLSSFLSFILLGFRLTRARFLKPMENLDSRVKDEPYPSKHDVQ